MIGWLVETTIGASLLMLLVLAVRRPVAELFGAQWAYALWLLPLLRFVLPQLPEAPVPVPAIVVLPAIDAMAAAPAPAAGGSGDWLWLLLALWAGGAIIFAIWQQSTYSAFMLHLGPEARPAQPERFGGVKVVESDAVDGPVAVGFLTRRIVVPLDFATRYSASEQRLALEHELVHHRRFDLFWNLAALAILALNWFNPIAHFAFRAFRADQELSCDAAVTRRAPEQRHDYACAVVKSASQPGLIAACPLNHAAFLKRRLKMMKSHRGGWARTMGGVAALSVFGAGGLLLSTPGAAQDEARAPRVVPARIGVEPIIDKKDIATLRAKCGRGDKARRDGSIVCDDSEAADPEVKAIMARTEKRVREHVEAAMPSEAELKRIEVKAAEAVARAHEAVAAVPAIDVEQRARIHEAVAKAQAAARVDRAHIIAQAQHAARADHARAIAQAHEAARHARVRMVHVDTEAIRRATLASVQATLPALRAEQLQELQASLAEMRRDLAEAAIERQRDAAEHAREMREMQAELKRELKDIEVDVKVDE